MPGPFPSDPLGTRCYSLLVFAAGSERLEQTKKGIRWFLWVSFVAVRTRRGLIHWLTSGLLVLYGRVAPPVGSWLSVVVSRRRPSSFFLCARKRKEKELPMHLGQNKDMTDPMTTEQ